ncbi:MAG: ABC transporter permease, partial [Pseudodonghicola sp.]|nr:ABC transporter permease [Pseudodonghicola sp.]
MRARAARGLWRAIVPLLVTLAVWQAVVSLSGVPRFILPGPGLVARALWENAGLIWQNTL